MSYHIALVGAGPTAIYCFQSLLTRERLPSSISVFERQRRAGQGTPYSPNWSDPIMLANIASIEIPALPQRLVEWLRSEPEARLRAFGIERETIGDRVFYTRLVLGEYLAAQFSALVNRARSLGVEVDVQTQATVTDVMVVGEKIRLTVTEQRAELNREFDYVILATGHQWPPDPEIRPGYFMSPWPASALARIHNCAVGIRGASLTAIDAAVAVANRHGEFAHIGREDLQYRPHSEMASFSLTMFSRKGILPEADFFHPIPYEPLVVCTVEAIKMLIENTEPENLLDAAFDLFRRELHLTDAPYTNSLGQPSASLEEFSVAYFDLRARTDPFAWARQNLTEASGNLVRQFTVPWRYAILRMHEVFGLLPPHLSDLDFERFSETLKPVFVDNYATVPHESIKRLLALHEAGTLKLEKLEDERRLDTRTPSRGATLCDGKVTIDFPAFIEATGQPVLGARDFPFPSLRRQGVIQDIKSEDGKSTKRGIAVDGAYHPISTFESSDRLFCLSLPFLLGQHPFAQGITSSAEMADVVGDAIQTAETSRNSKFLAAEPAKALLES